MLEGSGSLTAETAMLATFELPDCVKQLAFDLNFNFSSLSVSFLFFASSG